MPAPGPAQQAQADKAVRQFADRAGEGASAPWRAAIRRAARSAEDTLPDDLDQALARTDLRSDRASWWWPVFGVIQWCALAAALAGALWLLGIAALGIFQFPVPETPRVEGFPVPTLLLAAGILAGVLLALASGLISRLVATSRAAKARRRLRASSGEGGGRADRPACGEGGRPVQGIPAGGSDGGRRMTAPEGLRCRARSSARAGDDKGECKDWPMNR